jgi:hypothetical protein
MSIFNQEGVSGLVEGWQAGEWSIRGSARGALFWLGCRPRPSWGKEIQLPDAPVRLRLPNGFGHARTWIELKAIRRPAHLSSRVLRW